jgi:hypothetical protein
VVDASSSDVVDYFTRFFRGDFCAPATELEDDLLQDYPKLDVEYVERLNAPLTVSELI